MRRISGIFVTMTLLLGSYAQGQLQITEVMSDSRSAEPKWEWIEVRNAGASPIDLNGYVFDDLNGDILPDANISNANGTTIVPAGGVAVLYNGASFDLDPQLFRDAWQISGAVPMIAVTSAPSLNNGSDHIGLWPTHAAYEMDSVDDGMGTLIRDGFANSPVNFDYGTAPGAVQG